MPRGLTAGRCLAGGLLLGLAQVAVGQPRVMGGARQITLLEFAGTPVGAFPSQLDQLDGTMVVVEKDGVRMLRSSSPASEFRLRLPEQLPETFTLEFDLVAKDGGGADDLAVTGSNSASGSFATIKWGPKAHSVEGGGSPDPFTSTSERLGETVVGQPASVVVSFEGNTLKVYTNGERLYTLSNRSFARTRILLVSLGGQSEDNPVYLTRLRVAEGTVTAASVVTQDPSGRFSPTLGRSTAAPEAPPPAPSPVAPPPPPPPPATRPAPSLTPSRLDPPPPAPPPPAPPPSSDPTGIAGSGTGAGVAAVAGVVAQADAQGQVTVRWQAVPGATSYFVVRWLVGDNVCCGNTSPPEGMSALNWQDGGHPKPGTYGYRVYATTASLIYSGETTIDYTPTRPPSNTPAEPIPPNAAPAQEPPPKPPPPPPGPGETMVRFSFSTGSPVGVLVAWKKAPNATTYQIYRMKSPTQPGILLGTVPAPNVELFGDPNLAVAIDVELGDGDDVRSYQYWVVGVLSDGTVTEPGLVTPVTVGNLPLGGVMPPPTGVKATVGGTSAITSFTGQQGRGSNVTWTWDQPPGVPIGIYFATIDIVFSGNTVIPLTETIRVATDLPIPYLIRGGVPGPPYTMGIPAGAGVRFCVSYFPVTAMQRQAGTQGCVVSQVPP